MVCFYILFIFYFYVILLQMAVRSFLILCPVYFLILTVNKIVSLTVSMFYSVLLIIINITDNNMIV